MVSGICLVNGSSTTNGVNVTASSTVTISLQSLVGVTSWQITCFGTDPRHSSATINASLSINHATQTATFTAPNNSDGFGVKLLFQSVVNNGVDINGIIQPSYTATFSVNILNTAGNRTFATGETVESNATFGWTVDLDKLASTAVTLTGPASGDLSGSYPSPTVAKIHGSPVTTIGAANTILGTTDGVNNTYFTISNAQVGAGAAIAVNKLANGTSGQLLITNSTTPTWTTMGGDAIINGTGSLAISGGAVTNAKLANMTTDTFKGNVSGSTAAPSDVNLSSLAGTGITFSAHALNVNLDSSRAITTVSNAISFQKFPARVILWDDFFATSASSTTSSTVLQTAEGIWNLTGIVGTLSWIAGGVTGAPGLISFNTSTSTNDTGTIQFGVADHTRSTDIDFFDGAFSVNSAANAEYFFGFKSLSTANNYAYYHINNGVYTSETDNGSGTPQSTTLSGLAATTQATWRIQWDGTNFNFIVNSVTKSSHSTKIPNATGVFFFSVKTLTTATKSIIVDYFTLQSQSLSRLH